MEFLQLGREQGCSDIHFAVGTPPFLRIMGEVQPIRYRDLTENEPLPPDIDAVALQAASDWAFDRESPEQVTLSLLIVKGGQIVHERYAPGVEMATRTRTWSTAKSIAVTLIGMLVDEGRLALDENFTGTPFTGSTTRDADGLEAAG